MYVHILPISDDIRILSEPCMIIYAPCVMRCFMYKYTYLFQRYMYMSQKTCLCQRDMHMSPCLRETCTCPREECMCSRNTCICSRDPYIRSGDTPVVPETHIYTSNIFVCCRNTQRMFLAQTSYRQLCHIMS